MGEELLFILLNINELLSEVSTVTFSIFPSAITHHYVRLQRGMYLKLRSRWFNLDFKMVAISHVLNSVNTLRPK